MFKFRDRVERLASKLPHPWRWATIAFIGFLTIIIGIILMPLPGPGTLIVFIGVTILALEFEWARELSKKGEQGLEFIVRKIKEKIINPLRKNEQKRTDGNGEVEGER